MGKQLEPIKLITRRMKTEDNLQGQSKTRNIKTQTNSHNLTRKPGERDTQGNLTDLGNDRRRHKEGNTKTAKGDETMRERDREREQDRESESEITGLGEHT